MIKHSYKQKAFRDHFYMNLEAGKFKNLNLNFLQLMIILGMNAGLPTIVLGNSLKQISGDGAVICSIAVGNLILWLIGTAIISMAYEDRINAIENAKIYIGRYGGVLVALILAFALINWFVILISGSVATIDRYLHVGQTLRQGFTLKFGAGLGLFCTLLSIGKLNLIRWLSLFGFPVIFLYHLYMIFSADYSSESWTISFAGVITTILVYLPGILSLPTLFRHSRSRADSFLGFALAMLVIMLFQISSALMSTSLFFVFSIFSILVLIIYPLICNNSLNIYWASACWETYLPNVEGIKGGIIFGIMGVAFYTFIQISPQITFIADLINSYLSNFGIVLLVSFLMQSVIRHRPRTLAKLLNTVAWLIGCVVATIWKFESPENGIQALVAGIMAIVLFFLCVIFVEEVVWSIKLLSSGKRRSKT